MKTKPGYLIVGNWKMNKGPAEAKALTADIVRAVGDTRCTVAICPSFISLAAVSGQLKDSPILLGAQNCAEKESGAYTGEVSPAMLKEVGVSYVILGHSERRQHYGEGDSLIAARLRGALGAGLLPILCIGESEQQREKNLTEQLLSAQLEGALSGLTAADIKNIAIAYEPVWAIGTGKTATTEQAEQACAYIREQLRLMFDDITADGTKILYGGSMNAENASALLSCQSINGGLIGGASLKSYDFAEIAAAASRLENGHAY